MLDGLLEEKPPSMINSIISQMNLNADVQEPGRKVDDRSTIPLPHVQNAGSSEGTVPPEQPHFLPLQNDPPGLRKVQLFGMMLSFVQLVKDAKNASIHQSIEWFEDKKHTMSAPEKMGFNVKSLQGTLSQLQIITSTITRSQGEITSHASTD
ncbi:uncharacterized protein C2845_PM15G02050 [Panicum miliaceum]|uniref:Uncharacterized protein n=1 Tax=Panicum miliaceum TaxID=4540 RepID=A0A3L6Q984_PANMI|nr:uncharacterized protein C2845_PM15G02050 [Panicum miliaceum]